MISARPTAASAAATVITKNVMICPSTDPRNRPTATNVRFTAFSMISIESSNVITILLSIEIMLNAVNLTFVAAGRQFAAVDGQVIVFFVMTVAAAEAAVGLAIIIALFRHRESLNPEAFTSLKW